MNEPETIETELLAPDMSAVEQMERAQIDVQIATARKYPRSIGAVRKDMLSMATLDEETAESCFYKIPRGKDKDGNPKFIEGGSIRLAEIGLSAFGNVRAATRIVAANTGENPHVVIQAVCHDLEKNTAICIEKRRRITKKKFKDAIDEDDINLATNACSAIALRDAIFKIIPGVLIKPVLAAAKRVAVGDEKTLVERRDRAFGTFNKMGIPNERVCAAVGVKGIEEITLEHLETLTGLRSAIKEGQTTIDEAFPVAPKETKGIFGGDQKPAEPAQATNAPAAEKKPAKEKSPASRDVGEREGQAASNPKDVTKQPAPPNSDLASEKTLLADWMVRFKLQWPELQKMLLTEPEVFPFADSVGSFEDLSNDQAKRIRAARASLEGMFGDRPML